MIAKLVSECGYDSAAEVVRVAIINLYKDELPAYKVKMLQSGKKTQVQLKAEAEEREVEEGKAICEKLGGELKIGDGGGWVCQFKTYSFYDEFENEFPVRMLTPDVVDSQYYPSKERVLELKKLKNNGKQ